MKSGFSLLEVILALAVLGGAVVVLGEVNRLSLKNAAAARDLSQAQILCESKLTEIVTGITSPTTAVDKASFDSTTEALAADDPHWVYSIDSQTPNEPGLIAVRVTVTKNLPAAQNPVSFSLVRWMADPNYTDPSSSSGTSNSSGSNTNSSGGTSNGGT
jgi:prepilin-type N-terminal cleavage/methylation domain-containing protein